MELPEELRAPVPRDPSKAERLLAKSRAVARGAIGGGLAIVPVMLVMLWVQFGAVDALALGLSAGVGGLVSLVGFGLLFNQRKVLELFVHGRATLSRARKVTVSAGGDSAYVTIELEVIDGEGRTRAGTVVMLGRPDEVDLREGDTVPTLEHEGRLAIYTPKLGTIAVRLR